MTTTTTMQRMDLTKTATTTMTTTTGAAVSPPSLKSRSVLVMIMAMAVLHLMLFPSEKDATVFCQAFAPMARRRQHYNHYSLSSYSNVATITTTTTKSPIRVGLAASATASSSSTRNSSSSKNPLTPLFRQLPWNVRKEQERESRRLMKERNELFRQLGIVEDATYEEIVLATDNLIAAAGNDLKQKVKIEMAKDQILQLRLQERIIAAGGGGGVTGSNLGGIMSGSSSSMAITKEARAQSNFEQGSEEEDEVARKKAMDDAWTPPQWTQGLVVKPDEKHLQYQSKLWGGLTVLGLGLPPVIPYMGKFNWLICVAQLIYRGMPMEERERGGMGLNFGGYSGNSGKGHRKVAFALGFGIWAVGSLVLYAAMPTWVRGERWEPLLMYTLQNIFFFLASCYLQPYKG